MANDTCPWCGSEKRYEERYDCGSWCGASGFHRSVQCCERQIETVTAERDELRRRVDEAPVGKIIGFHDGCILDIELDEGERVALFDRVRIVRDDQPGEES